MSSALLLPMHTPDNQSERCRQVTAMPATAMPLFQLHATDFDLNSVKTVSTGSCLSLATHVTLSQPHLWYYTTTAHLQA